MHDNVTLNAMTIVICI